MTDPKTTPIEAIPADLPGLFDVRMADGSWHELTTGQLASLLDPRQVRGQDESRSE